MFPWTYGLALLGLVVGALVGSDAAQSVDASALGGEAVQLWLQYKVFNWITGLFMAAGIIVGFVIDLVRYKIDDSRRERRFGSWRSTPKVTPAQQEEAWDSIAARRRRRQVSLASGESLEEFEAAEAELSRRHAEQAAKLRSERFAQVAADTPIHWPRD